MTNSVVRKFSVDGLIIEKTSDNTFIVRDSVDNEFICTLSTFDEVLQYVQDVTSFYFHNVLK